MGASFIGASKRGSLWHRDLVHKKLRSWEILCEECGAIYDARTEEGLCCHCAGHGPEDGQEPDTDEDRTGER